MSATLKSKIASAQAKLERTRAKHANWHPVDKKTMDGWAQMLEQVRQQAEFASHPMMAKYIRYITKTVTEIDHVLLTDKTLPADERRILMDKRDMHRAALDIFVPKEKIVEFIDRQASKNMTDDGPSDYPQRERDGVPRRW